MSLHLHSFHGGLHMPDHKAMSTGKPLAHCPLPARLIVPAQQHIGETGELLVAVGDQVLKGQPLTRANGFVSAPVHAPTSGTIADIGEYPIPHPSGLSALCIVIETDGRDEWTARAAVDDYLSLSPIEIRNKVRAAGIVGLGGAAFPTAVKLNRGSHQIKQLILNGAECEPYISCDDMLMRESSEEIIHGAQIILHALEAEDCVIAVEDNKPDAIRALEASLKKLEIKNIHVVKIPTRYPTGGERQLIRVLTGLEVPNDGLPADLGLVVQNVATSVSVYRAIALGEPLIRRIVTVTGDAVNQPQNCEVLIGTLMSDVIQACGGYGNGAESLVMGGPMMGFALHTDELPVIKGCNCLLVQTAVAISTANAQACIRCGECVRVCPANLLPQQLYWMASSKNFDMVQDYHLFDCIECGCCAYVCPSHIPLVHYYRFAKTEIWNMERERKKSDHARIRHEFREQRLENEKRERDERMRKKKEALAKKNTADDKPDKSAIDAAVERSKAKKQAVENTSQANNDS